MREKAMPKKTVNLLLLVLLVVCVAIVPLVPPAYHDAANLIVTVVLGILLYNGK